MADASARGQFVWYDLMTSDPKGAEAFYSTVVGWGTSAWDGPMPYTMWTVDAVPMGGVVTLPPGAGAPPHWLGYVATPDVDATVEQASGLLARVLVPPTDIPSAGRFAVLADPQGAMFAVFTSPGSPLEPESSPAIGNFSWHELMTTDNAAAFAFYQALFGWEKQAEHDMGEAGVYLLFHRNGVEMGGMFNRPAGVPTPPNWLQYIRVGSVDRVLALVTANGGAVLNGPVEVPGGDWIAQCRDAQGAPFAIHSTRR